jgi:Zn-dependent protease
MTVTLRRAELTLLTHEVTTGLWTVQLLSATFWSQCICMFWIAAEQTAIPQFCVHHGQTGGVITDLILRVLDVLYCDYFIWSVFCTVAVLTGFVMCGCFGNMCICIYCVCIVCTVILYCFVYVYLFLFVLSVLV